MGTVAEAWLEQGRSEGRAEGVAEGIEKGQAGIVLRLMELRFGVLSDAVGDRVRGASAPESTHAPGGDFGPIGSD